MVTAATVTAATAATSVCVKMCSLLLQNHFVSRGGHSEMQSLTTVDSALTSYDPQPLQKVRFGSEIFNRFQQQRVRIHNSDN